MLLSGERTAVARQPQGAMCSSLWAQGGLHSSMAQYIVNLGDDYKQLRKQGAISSAGASPAAGEPALPGSSAGEGTAEGLGQGLLCALQVLNKLLEAPQPGERYKFLLPQCT